MDIKASTSIYGIFGHPVSHSLSPVMHNCAFEELDLDCAYVAFDVEIKDLATAVSAIKVLKIQGVNITVPHKEAMVSKLDEVTQPVVLTGAVNTIKNENGKLVGYNTDVPGVMRAIKEELDFNPANKSALVIGAGGASRAVTAALCLNGISRITVVNRTESRAVKVVDSFKDQFQHVIFDSYSLSDSESIKSFIKDTDIIINSSSAGMGDIPQLDIPLEKAQPECVVYDLVYKPLVTPLVKQARDLGLRAESGLGMLLYQGVEAFEIWTEQKAPVELMRKVLFNSR